MCQFKPKGLKRGRSQGICTSDDADWVDSVALHAAPSLISNAMTQISSEDCGEGLRGLKVRNTNFDATFEAERSNGVNRNRTWLTTIGSDGRIDASEALGCLGTA